MIWKTVPCNYKGFTKFPLNLQYLSYNAVLQILEICHYKPGCDVSEMALYQVSQKKQPVLNKKENIYPENAVTQWTRIFQN